MHIWMFPPVKNSSPRKTHSRRAKAPSNARRSVGWRDDPGVRILEIKSGAAAEAVSVPECTVVLVGADDEDMADSMQKLRLCCSRDAI